MRQLALTVRQPDTTSVRTTHGRNELGAQGRTTRRDLCHHRFSFSRLRSTMVFTE